MPQPHRFFFVLSGTIIYPFVFLFGMTIGPIILLFRCWCSKETHEEVPIKPTPPEKPIKPIEPPKDSPPEIIDDYKRNKDQYRVAKTKWKKQLEEFKKLEKEQNDKYEQQYKDYKKGIESGDIKRKEFGNLWCFMVSVAIFCRTGQPPLMNYFLKEYVKSKDNLNE